MLPDRHHRLFAVGAGRYDVGLRFRLKQPDQPLPSQRLIVRDYHSERHPAGSRELLPTGTGV